MVAFLSPGEISLCLFLIFILFPKLNPFSPSNIRIFCFNKYSCFFFLPFSTRLSSAFFPKRVPICLRGSLSFFFSLEYKKYFFSLKRRIFLPPPPFFNLFFIHRIVCFHLFGQYLIFSLLSQMFIFVWFTLLSEPLPSLSNSPFFFVVPHFDPFDSSNCLFFSFFPNTFHCFS